MTRGGRRYFHYFHYFHCRPHPPTHGQKGPILRDRPSDSDAQLVIEYSTLGGAARDVQPFTCRAAVQSDFPLRPLHFTRAESLKGVQEGPRNLSPLGSR